VSAPAILRLCASGLLTCRLGRRGDRQGRGRRRLAFALLVTQALPLTGLTLLLAQEFGDIARQEYAAVGIRVALHPQVDLATEPRWPRINGTFGEDAERASRMPAAYIRGFQGEILGPQSVACMLKHFPGGGHQKDGDDPHFAFGREQVYPGDNFDYHLRPFEAAFAAGVSQGTHYYGMPVGTQYEEVILALGGRSGLLFQHGITEGEGADTADIELPNCQVELVKAVAQTGVPAVGVVYTNRPMALTAVVESLPALLWGYYRRGRKTLLPRSRHRRDTSLPGAGRLQARSPGTDCLGGHRVRGPDEPARLRRPLRWLHARTRIHRRLDRLCL
jgi:hypothetical protein